ncbi:hypothetical protein EVAR_14359_1 [Eumeta japonica]|uniref:Uncharacterized protein n=1 Tax=Eumeta variegata TaxID=151549 RepID=A0A4C1TX34_EUMVA|nr:hypothetical protein EVAR_14359_1 [Eumeta japonica]
MSHGARPTRLVRCAYATGARRGDCRRAITRNTGEKKVGRGALNLRIASFAGNSEQQIFYCALYRTIKYPSKINVTNTQVERDLSALLQPHFQQLGLWLKTSDVKQRAGLIHRELDQSRTALLVMDLRLDR